MQAWYFSLFFGVLIAMYVLCEYGPEFVDRPEIVAPYWVGELSAILSWLTILVSSNGGRLMHFLICLLFLSAIPTLSAMIVYSTLWTGPLKVLVFAQIVSLVAAIY